MKRLALLLMMMMLAACAADSGDGADDEDDGDATVAEDAEALTRGKVLVGIADSDPDTLVGDDWHDLGVHWARMVVPWNVALVPRSCAIRSSFEQYLASVRAARARVVVMFGPDAGGDPHACNTAARHRAPNLDMYRAAMTAFTRSYPGQRVLAAWNEPDFSDGPVVEDLRSPLNQHPRRAAEYYIALKHRCEHCLVVAGEFASNPAAKTRYWQPYARELAAHDIHPRVWTIHPTRDLILFAQDAAGDGKKCTSDTMSGCVTKTFATWVASLSGKATVWLTETEAPVARPEDSHLRAFNALSEEKREHIQANAMRFLFEEIVKSHPNVTRVFIYPLRERPNKRNDSGLVDGSRRRESYGVIRRYVD